MARRVLFGVAEVVMAEFDGGEWDPMAEVKRPVFSAAADGDWDPLKAPAVTSADGVPAPLSPTFGGPGGPGAGVPFEGMYDGPGLGPKAGGPADMVGAGTMGESGPDTPTNIQRNLNRMDPFPATTEGADVTGSQPTGQGDGPRTMPLADGSPMPDVGAEYRAARDKESEKFGGDQVRKRWRQMYETECPLPKRGEPAA